jgi:hypothetical protein
LGKDRFDPLFRADGPRTSHAQAQMDERRENDRDFPIDARIAGRSRRFCECRLRPQLGGSTGRVNGMRGQLTKMTRGFTPPAGHLWPPLPPVVACGPEFSPDRYT